MRARPTSTSAAIIEMLEIFAGVCTDCDTLRELIVMAPDREQWKGAHALFQKIRQKTLEAERHNDRLAVSQYCFEEMCAKTLYNLSGSEAPFDADSAFWVLPLAISFGRKLGFAEPSQITSLLEA